jgi:hypothetical protein
LSARSEQWDKWDKSARARGVRWATWAREVLDLVAMTELELGRLQRISARRVVRVSGTFPAAPLTALLTSPDGGVIVGWRDDEAKAEGSLKAAAAAGTARPGPAPARARSRK